MFNATVLFLLPSKKLTFYFFYNVYSSDIDPDAMKAFGLIAGIFGKKKSVISRKIRLMLGANSTSLHPTKINVKSKIKQMLK